MPRVLLVEDEETVRLLYQQELQERGYEVVCARDGRMAVQLAREVSPDVVIMDINLPEQMDGLESMSRILSHDRSVPVIINTGYGEYKDNFKSWMADAYVVKTADVRPLMQAVQDVLRSKGVAPKA